MGQKSKTKSDTHVANIEELVLCISIKYMLPNKCCKTVAQAEKHAQESLGTQEDVQDDRNAEDAEDAEDVQHNLVSAISGLGCRVRVDKKDSLKLLRFAAQRFSMKLNCQMEQKRVGNVRIRYVKAIELVKDMPTYLDKYELRCPECSEATYVRVTDWSEHQREYHGHSVGWE